MTGKQNVSLTASRINEYKMAGLPDPKEDTPLSPHEALPLIAFVQLKLVTNYRFQKM